MNTKKEKKDKLIGLAIPKDLEKRIRQESEKTERTFSGQVRYILKEWAERQAA